MAEHRPDEQKKEQEQEQQFTILPVTETATETEKDKDKHSEKETGKSSGKPSAQDFVNPGPAVPGNVDLPPKASRAELEARAAELNRK
ncbi:hypothetical protein KEM52_000227 [Ascosphaera acerosa]|nr:hypothetical protein KEM52_000227 [Ascosphaera acerosa]